MKAHLHLEITKDSSYSRLSFYMMIRHRLQNFIWESFKMILKDLFSLGLGQES